MAIIGILVLLAMPKFMGYTKEAKFTKFINNTKQLENASERYYMENQDWPRLTDTPYTSLEINTFAQKIYDATGKEVALDTNGSYYDIDYSKLSQYINVPDDKLNYIIQNPVGNIYALESLTPEAEIRLATGSVIINKPILALNIGEFDTLVATIIPTTAVNKTVTWISSNPSVATVDTNGKVTAVSSGTSIITVKTAVGNYTTTCAITVNTINNYLKFNGINSYTMTNDSPSLDILNAITIEANVMFNEITTKEIVLKNNNSNTGVGPYELFQSGTNIYLRLRSVSDSGGYVEIRSNTQLSLNVWHHIAGVWNGTTMKLYIDGVQDTSTLSFSGPLYNSSGSLTFGAYANVLYPYAGGLDEVRIWKIARTSQQILDNMNIKLIGNEPGLQGYWKMNEGIGSIIYDSSSNHNNGTMFGNVTWVKK